MSKRKREMSPAEQRIYFSLRASEGNPLTTDMIRGYGLSNRKTLMVALASLVKKGWLVRVKNGVYVVRDSPDEPVDPFLLAPLTYNGYLAFSSALYVYNAIDERPSTVYVANKSMSRVKTLYGLDIEVRAVALGRRALGMTKLDGYTVSTPAKTLYDCFYLPEYAGGYSKVLAGATKLDLGTGGWREFVEYADMFEKSAFKRKVGYMLDLLGRDGAISIPKWVTRKLNVRGVTAKLGAGRGGRYSREWDVLDYIGDSLLGGLYG